MCAFFIFNIISSNFQKINRTRSRIKKNVDSLFKMLIFSFSFVTNHLSMLEIVPSRQQREWQHLLRVNFRSMKACCNNRRHLLLPETDLLFCNDRFVFVNLFLEAHFMYGTWVMPRKCHIWLKLLIRTLGPHNILRTMCCSLNTIHCDCFSYWSHSHSACGSNQSNETSDDGFLSHGTFVSLCD